jgi:hypothetical protein
MDRRFLDEAETGGMGKPMRNWINSDAQDAIGPPIRAEQWQDIFPTITTG